jgi:hypothetical protein
MPSTSSSSDKQPTFTSMQESAQTNNMPARLRNQAILTKNPRFNYGGGSMISQNLNEDDVINISNDEDDDEDSVPSTSNNLKPTPAIIKSIERIEAPVPIENKPIAAIEAQNTNKPPITQNLAASGDSTYKEKVFKPNLVGRKPRVAQPIATTTKPTNPNTETNSQNQNHVPPYNYNTNNQSGNYSQSTVAQSAPQNQSIPTTTQYSGSTNNFKTNSANPQQPPLVPPPAYSNNFQRPNYPASAEHTPGSSGYYGNNYNYNNYPPPPSAGNNYRQIPESYRQQGARKFHNRFNNYKNNGRISNTNNNSETEINHTANFGYFKGRKRGWNKYSKNSFASHSPKN